MRRTDKLWGGFSLIQDDRFFKLGQDTMLLSDFACPPARGSIMDLGCGNGALSVLLCARHPHITVTGLEIQPEVAALAKENITHNGLEQRMRVICGDMKQSQSLFSTGSFDYVVCNPPYFAQNSGFSAKGVNKSTARQDSSGTAADAVRAEYPNFELYVVDNALPCATGALLALEAVRQRSAGLTAKQLVDWANEAKTYVHGYFTLESFDALAAGGRIPPAAAQLTAKLDVKPELSYDLAGSLSLIGVNRGRKKALKSILKSFRESYVPDRTMPIAIMTADAEKDGDWLEAAIRKGTGQDAGGDLTEIMYEGYASGGVAVIVETATDNKNRTVADVRHIFTKHGGSLGESGSVAFQFDRKGVIMLSREKYPDEDAVMNLALEAGADDVRDEDESWGIYTSFEDFNSVREALEGQSVEMESAEINMVPKVTVPVDAETARKIMKLNDALEEHDDVQNVYFNFELPDDFEE